MQALEADQDRLGSQGPPAQDGEAEDDEAGREADLEADVDLAMTVMLLTWSLLMTWSLHSDSQGASLAYKRGADFTGVLTGACMLVENTVF